MAFRGVSGNFYVVFDNFLFYCFLSTNFTLKRFNLLAQYDDFYWKMTFLVEDNVKALI